MHDVQDKSDLLELADQEQVRGKQKELYARMIDSRDKWIHHRTSTGVESRWRLARDLYYGTDEFKTPLEDTLANGPALPRQDGQPRSRIVVNIVRPKCDQAIARETEILLPVDDRCWGIKNTPVPQTIQTMLGNSQQTVIPGTLTPTGMTADMEAQFYMQAAEEARAQMERKIDDALNECSYNGEQRRVIEDKVILGTGIMEGPYLKKQTAKVWQPQNDGSAVLAEVESIIPASRRRDPYDVWFDPAAGADHQRGVGVWDRRSVTRRELRDLIGVPGYDSAAIKAVLAERPTRVFVGKGRVLRQDSSDTSYELFTYHGFIEPDDLSCCSEFTGRKIEKVDFGVVMFVNDQCIGAIESWIPDKSLPFDVVNWRKAEDTPQGYGLPHEMEHQQRVVIAAWRQIMDHARTVSGNQIVIKGGQIIPVDGRKVITPDKLWEAKDEVDDVRKAFAGIEFHSKIPDLMAIAKAAMEFVDHETSMPQLLGGERGQAPETVGGMILLFQSASAVLRMRMKHYDDRITRPHISRYYDYFMANDPDPSIKGDFEVDARGATTLLEKDISNQAALNLAAITSNPRYQAFLDPQKELDVILKALKIMPKDVKLSEQKIQQNLQQPPQQPQDPRILAAQLNLEGKKMDIADRKEQRQFDAQSDATEQQIKAAQLEYNKAREQAEFELATEKMAIDRDGTIIKIQQDQQLTREQIAAKERMQALKLDSDRQLFNAEASLRVQTGQGI